MKKLCILILALPLISFAESTTDPNLAFSPGGAAASAVPSAKPVCKMCRQNNLRLNSKQTGADGGVMNQVPSNTGGVDVGI